MATLVGYGGAGSVTGANFLLTTSHDSVLIDCGLEQGIRAHEKNSQPFPYDVASVSTLLVTHAHADHIGRIGELCARGFRGTLYSTEETKALAEIMLQDALHLEEGNALEEGRPMRYQWSDCERAFSQWKTAPYHTKVEVSDTFSFVMYDAGHILGSAMFLCTYQELGVSHTFLATGDLGNSPSVLLPDTEIPQGAEVVLMESVYGDRNHEEKEYREQKFKDALLRGIERRGTIIIPAFSLERTQVILYLLNELIEAHAIPSVPVFIDSPLAIRVTDVYERAYARYKSDVQKDMKGGDDIFDFPRLKETLRGYESRTIEKTHGPKIIIAGSGMSSGGRVLGHEKIYLPHKENMVILMGYQSPGTVGRMLLEGSSQVVIEDESIPVKAEIVSILGFSGHKDSDNLVSFIGAMDPLPRKVFVAMGEYKSASFLAQKLRDYGDVDTTVVEEGKSYQL